MSARDKSKRSHWKWLSADSGCKYQQRGAFYFIGLRWELQGKKADAEAYYRQALETKARPLSAYRSSR